MHRANRPRRRARATDRWSFQHLDTVAQIRRELELFALDRTTQPFAQVAKLGGPLDHLAARRCIWLSVVFCAPMYATKQITHAVLEGRVAAGASPTTGRAKVRHGRVAEHASAAIHARERGLLLHGLQEIA